MTPQENTARTVAATRTVAHGNSLLPRYLSLAMLIAAVLLILAAGRTASAQSAVAGQANHSSADFSAPTEIEGQYSYIRAVDGGATLLTGDSASRSDAEPNLPLLVGDRVWVRPGSRVDLVLSDGSQLTLDGDTEVLLENLASSPDSEAPDEATRLSLIEGSLILTLSDYWHASELPVVDTQNTRVYVQDLGVYVIEAEDREWTRVTARQGFVEVVDQQGSSVVRGGEELEIVGDLRAVSTLRAAGGESSLERWAYRQEDAAVRASDQSLDQPLEGTAQLVEHGDWVDVEGSRAWKPRASSSWRPYYQGRWVSTPSGLYWVSYDPWSSVTYQYGSWDLHDRYGWLWYPGYSYAPAHVYWYWGSSYAGWIPSGYYSRYYRHRYPGFGFRYGVYGYAGGGFGLYDYWNFCPIRYFGYRRQYHHYRDGRSMRGRGGLERGILTTDTRGLGPRNWRHPDEVREVLQRRWRDAGDARRGELPDVTAMVARPERLPKAIETSVLTAAKPSTKTISKGAALPRSGIPAKQAARPRDPSATGSASRVPSRSAGVPRVDSNGGQRSPRAAAPRSATPRPGTSGSATRRETPGRRVLDGIRGRNGGPTSARPAPRATAARPSSARPSAAVRPPARSSASGSNSSRPATSARPSPARPSAARPSAARPPSRGTVNRGSSSKGASSKPAVRPPTASPRSAPSRRPAARPPTSARSSSSRSSVRPPARRPATRPSSSSARPKASSPPPSSSRRSAPAARSPVSRSPKAAAPSRSSSRPSARPSPSRSSASRSSARRPAVRSPSRSSGSSRATSAPRAGSRPSSSARASSSSRSSSSRSAVSKSSGSKTSSSKSSGSVRRPPT